MRHTKAEIMEGIEHDKAKIIGNNIMYNYTPIANLEKSAVELNGLLKQTKKLKVEAKQQIFGSVENITVGDNSSFTINQNQTLMILQVEALAEEILQTVMY